MKILPVTSSKPPVAGTGLSLRPASSGFIILLNALCTTSGVNPAAELKISRLISGGSPSALIISERFMKMFMGISWLMPSEKLPASPGNRIFPIFRTTDGLDTLPGEKGASVGMSVIELNLIISSSPSLTSSHSASRLFIATSPCERLMPSIL